MKAVLVAGDPQAVSAARERLAEAGVEAVASAPAEPAEGEIAALAAGFLAFEEEVAEARPAAVVLADAGDRALAAALVATKLLLPVYALDRAAASEDRNAELIRLIADESGDVGRLLTLLRR